MAAGESMGEPLSASDPRQVAWAPNTHEFVARLYSCFDPAKPLRVLASASEFHSFRRQTRRLQEAGRLVVEEIHKHVYKTPAVPPESQHDYKTEFLSANKGWGVVRKSDNQVIATAGDETGAKLKLEQHLRLIAA